MPPHGSRANLARLLEKEGEMTDRTIREAVAATFERMALGPGIAATVEDGIATLFGRTADAGQCFAAEAAVCRTPGVRAVINRIEVGTGPGPDVDVARAAADALAAIEDLAGNPICASVADGVVTLHGEVPEERQRIVPEQELLRLANVADVRNLLHVALPSGDPARQLLVLLRRQGVGAEGLQIAVRGGVVALSGKAESWFDRDVAERLAWTLPGVHAVTNQVDLPPDAAVPEAGDGIPA
jgi:osmotically-inducible protein OsmY